MARSPDLTAAVGLLAAVTLLGFWGGDLVSAMAGGIRATLEGELSDLELEQVAGGAMKPDHGGTGG